MVKPEWAVKKPRSSRTCYRCEHKHASHIQERCLKILVRKPKRAECKCNGFVSNADDMKFKIDRLLRKVTLLEEAVFQAKNAEHTHPENTLKALLPSISNAVR